MGSRTVNDIFQDTGIEVQSERDAVMDHVKRKDLAGLIQLRILKEKPTQRLYSNIETALMELDKKWLYTRYPVEKGPHKDVAAVVMGACGNGKTALMNNICGTAYAMGQGMHSVTQNITAELVNYIPEDGRFIVYDTAGTTSDVRVSLHAQLLRASLTHKPLNVVFAQTKLGVGRGIDSIKELMRQLQMVGSYSNQVVFLISHFDLAENPKQMVTDFDQALKEKKLDNQVVFYSNTACTQSEERRKELANTLYNICSNYQKTSIYIGEDDFFRKFRLGDLDKLFELEFKSNQQDLYDIKSAYIDYSNRLPDDGTRQMVVQELEVSFRLDLKEVLEAFTLEAGTRMSELDYFGMFFELQKVIMDFTEEFHRYNKRFRNNNFLSLQVFGKKIELKDLVKMCPSCGLIWLRVDSCPKTYCGARPSSFWDFNFVKRYSRYRAVKKGNRRQLEQVSINRANDETVKVDSKFELKIEQLKRSKASNEKNGRVGCGYQLMFEELPRLPNIDEILYNWNQSTKFDLRELVNADEAARSQRAAQEKEVQQNLKEVDNKLSELEARNRKAQ